MKTLYFIPSLLLMVGFALICTSCCEIFDSCDDDDQDPEIEISGFENDVDGWTITGDAQGGSNIEASYSPFNGLDNTGYIFAEDDVTGGVWYFSAPDKFLGDQSSLFGGDMSFWLIQDSAMSSQFESKDIILQGDGKEIYYLFDSYPGLAWTKYRVKVSSSSNWFNLSNQQATDSEIQSILSNITGLFIRGEYESGPDTGGLDQFEYLR
ncbi:MAG: hypothetical protein HKN67_05500 [Saprospiraceae bacterium]|nr:hypothetical protein [Saprospiraceae bacterium]NNK90714.1 hypothetical protein [Saprospiraceae bacterium]